MKTELTLSEALAGYEMAATARRLSPHTIADYKNTFRKLVNFLPGDPLFTAITREQIIEFLASQGKEISNKTLLNYHVGLSSLWAWASNEGIVPANIVHLVERPKAQKTIIQPLSEKDIRDVISALSYSAYYKTTTGKTVRNRLDDADRNTAIVLLLLDTGIRATELCELIIRRADLRSANKSIVVHGGKGNKDRQIPISAKTAQAIWKYLLSRKGARADEPLFVTDQNRALCRDQLGDMLRNAGERADIPDVHPHRFRHTFAIFYLRNGGDIYTLQAILGHTTLDMVKVYLQIAQTDLECAHRKASPVDNMHL
jgi:site-specific recombinase XerD